MGNNSDIYIFFVIVNGKNSLMLAYQVRFSYSMIIKLYFLDFGLLVGQNKTF